MIVDLALVTGLSLCYHGDVSEKRRATRTIMTKSQSNLSFKALHNAETWPADYLKIIKQECPKELRSSNAIRLVVATENGTFQDNASKLFNNLPETIRNCKDYRTFLRLSKNFLRNRVQSD